MWKSDNQEEFQIDQNTVKYYFDKTQDLVFNESTALLEEKAILPYIKISKQSSVLDLGCGNGRWARLLAPKCKEYVGVELSEKFVEYVRRKIKMNNCEFICMPAHEYLPEKKFDLIMVIGLITYMNDSEIRKMTSNCKKMLKSGGKLILRNVVLKDGDGDRRVYDYQPNFIKRLLRRPRYQIIRRSIKKELELFRMFKLVRDSDIEGTGYHFYVFE